MSFKDKVVLITGASTGIGATTAIHFAKEAANVAISGRNVENLNSVAEKCEEYGAVILRIVADMTKDEDVKDMVEKTIEKFGKLDILINNAGVLRKCDILDENYMASYDLITNTNMRAVALTTNLAAPHIIKTKGNIVNISSIAGIKVAENFSAYKASKAALDHFTRCIALELAPYGVRVNAVSPGPVNTGIFDTASMKNALDYYVHNTALKRVSAPEEISDLILYVASNKALSITGSNYLIDNGIVLK